VTGTATGGALPVATGPETAREVWRVSRGHRVRLGAVGVVGVAGAAVDLVVPVAIGFLVDQVRDGTADLGTVLTLTAVMALSAILGAAGTAVTIVLATRVYHSILARLRERLVERGLTLPQHLVERAGTGDLISRSSDDVTAVADAAPAVIPALTVAAFTIIVSLGSLAALEWPYAAAFAVVLPVYVLALRWYLRTGPGVYRAERAAMSARAQQILESQRGYATVLGFGLGEQRHRTVLTASWAVAVQALRARTVQSMLNARLNLAECLSLAAVLIVGFILIDSGTSTVGGATTAMLLVLRLLGPINQVLLVIDTIQSAAASLNRMIGIATIPVADAEEPSTVTSSSVRLREVSFQYGVGPRVLDDITLDIPTGQRVAVVGASGDRDPAGAHGGDHPGSTRVRGHAARQPHPRRTGCHRRPSAGCAGGHRGCRAAQPTARWPRHGARWWRARADRRAGTTGGARSPGAGRPRAGDLRRGHRRGRLHAGGAARPCRRCRARGSYRAGDCSSALPSRGLRSDRSDGARPHHRDWNAL
jgi:ABC-type bacteriocin/lantibiotic exporter with double-glycine peptidase domain